MSGIEPAEADRLRAAGMTIALHAREDPDRLAILSPVGDLSYGQLNAQANQLVRALRARGLGRGDSVALLCSNRPEFAVAYAAAVRSGLRLTPLNWHLQLDEAAYVVQNCEARAFIADVRFASVAQAAAAECPKAEVRLAIGGAISGFESFEAALAAESPDDIPDPVLGGTMLYTSGTTGRPKGVHRREAPAPTGVARLTAQVNRYQPERDRNLCLGPLYHAAPLAFNLVGSLAAGVGCVLVDKFDAEDALRTIERARVTHTHMVATMFHRLLALPDTVKSKYDLSSLRVILHGAAPTPVHVKKAMIDWLGPVVHEYYAATEGGGTFIFAEEWLKKPGSVGRPAEPGTLEIRDDAGKVVTPGTVGTIWFKAPAKGRFEYWKDSAKTASSYDGDWFTMRDMGYQDADGYVFLTGRTAELIISGGVNIYPAEIDAVLLMHPAVRDAAAIGVPNEEFGEEVKAVVQLADGFDPSDALARELLEHCRARLAHFKCPRSIDFDPSLPRSEAGKVQRRAIRDRYWQALGRQI
ncbi:MAG TPA: AMP-binding protein [Myxococcota bacterium]|nr:AMP-binding protein [Myxococcota bacterium]